MRKFYVLCCFSVMLALAGGLWLRAQQVDRRPLAALLPPGALLYLEAKDFRGLLNQWNTSQERKNWLASDNFGVLSRSRLVRRLGEAQDQFATVAAIPVAFNLLNEVAGTRSAFAFYNLSDLTFVYLTNLVTSRLEQSGLWRNRTRYRTRRVAGISFFLNTDAASHRTVAFAAYRDWLVIATGEAQMAQTLTLLAGASGGSGGLAGEAWFSETVGKAATQGDLRLVCSLDALLATPQFRTYWIQRNASELKPFTAALADLFERPDGFAENRVLLRRTPEPKQTAGGSLSEVLRYVPEKSSLYRAWLDPDSGTLAGTVAQVITGETTRVEGLDRTAPWVSSAAAESGSVSDLETRIDQPPFVRSQNQSTEQVAAAIASVTPVSMLHVQLTRVLNDNVFVLPQSGVVIECRHANRGLLERALASTELLYRGTLDPLHLTVTGNTIVLSRVDLRPGSSPPSIAADTTYTAAFNKEVEWPIYKRLFGTINRVAGSPEAAAADAAPPFFSKNLASLGDTLARLRGASIETQDGPTELRETVRYQFK